MTINHRVIGEYIYDNGKQVIVDFDISLPYKLALGDVVYIDDLVPHDEMFEAGYDYLSHNLKWAVSEVHIMKSHVMAIVKAK